MRRAVALVLIVGAWLVWRPATRAQTAPLPERDAFLAEARKRLAGNDELQGRFSFRERSTELHLNPLGRMGTGAVLVHEVYPQPNQEITYRRLVERDGKPVPAADRLLQDRRYLARFHEWQRALKREGQSEREARLKKEAELRERDQRQSREALDLFTFTIDQRDLFEGQPAIVVSFVPKGHANPRTREGRIAYGFAGRVWIHEHEHEVMFVDAKAIDDVSFGFGMVARLNDGSTAQFTRRRIDGVWLPVESRFTGSGRALLLRKVVIEFHRTYFDYRPYDPATIVDLLQPAVRP